MYIDRNGRKWIVEHVPLSSLAVGDTVVHSDLMVTVTKESLKRCKFMGVTLRGDSYMLVRLKIRRLTSIAP